MGSFRDSSRKMKRVLQIKLVSNLSSFHVCDAEFIKTPGTLDHTCWLEPVRSSSPSRCTFSRNGVRPQLRQSTRPEKKRGRVSVIRVEHRRLISFGNKKNKDLCVSVK